MSDIKFKGKIFLIEHDIQPNGKIFEYAHRSPGVRAIIRFEDEILLTKEFRESLNTWDIRLPGGKVFDTLDEYLEFLETGRDIKEACKNAVIREISEEVGAQVDDSEVTYFRISKSGATVKWDLHYYIINLKSKDQIKKQNLTDTEKILPHWYTTDELKEKIIFEDMSEERSAMMLLRYLSNYS